MRDPKNFMLIAMLIIIVALIVFAQMVENRLNSAKEELAATKAELVDLERKANPPKGVRTINLRVDDKDRTAWLGARIQCQSAILMVENNADGDPSVRFSGCSE